MTPQHDFLDNLANDQHQKMLREIANDNITPKKRDTLVQNDVYERKDDDFEDDGLDYDTDVIPLAEF
jgi:phosphopantothenoylcysteine synthetase/decarboxylase